MIIKKLQFENFRNLENSSIEFFDNVNVIYGNNAQGKTNLIEILWLLCGGHSFRAGKENEMIKFGENFYKIYCEFYSYNRDQKAKIEYVKNKRKITINDVDKKSSSYLTEIYSAVLFSPDHLELIKSNPGLRRKFIDTAICQNRIKYANILTKYNKILNQRNILLKDSNNKNIDDTLCIWDEYLSESGAKIIKERMNYISSLKKVAEDFHRGISDNKEILTVKYQTNLDISEENTEQEIKEILYNAYLNTRNEDIRYGHTNIGVHRDDISILINDLPAKIYASQGQQRSAVLSLKLSEAKLLSDTNEEKPIILLDDVLSELDNLRQDYLLNQIKDYQVFITCCEESNKKQLKEGKIFNIKNGVIN